MFQVLCCFIPDIGPDDNTHVHQPRGVKKQQQQQQPQQQQQQKRESYGRLQCSAKRSKKVNAATAAACLSNFLYSVKINNNPRKKVDDH